jgi:hypothetical protein
LQPASIVVQTSAHFGPSESILAVVSAINEVVLTTNALLKEVTSPLQYFQP